MKQKEKYTGVIEKDRESIKTFMLSTRKKIVKRHLINYWVWIILSIIIMIINLTIISIAVYILIIIINEVALHPNDQAFIREITAPALILALALLSFISFSILAIFQAKTKKELYKSAYRNIQFESIKFSQKIDHYGDKDAKNIYLKNIKNIKNSVYNRNHKKLPWHKIIKAAILKDADV